MDSRFSWRSYVQCPILFLFLLSLQIPSELLATVLVPLICPEYIGFGEGCNPCYLLWFILFLFIKNKKRCDSEEPRFESFTWFDLFNCFFFPFSVSFIFTLSSCSVAIAPAGRAGL